MNSSSTMTQPLTLNFQTDAPFTMWQKEDTRESREHKVILAAMAEMRGGHEQEQPQQEQEKPEKPKIQKAKVPLEFMEQPEEEEEEGGQEARYLQALATTWGRGPEAVTAMARHLATGQAEVRERLQSEERQEEERVVVELTVDFLGLNLASLAYLLMVSEREVLVSPCLSSCPHPPTPHLREQHSRDHQFGVPLPGLLSLCRPRLPSLGLPQLSRLLARANVCFWPLARVDRTRLCMEARGAGEEGEEGENMKEQEVARVGHFKKRKARVSVGLSEGTKISLVGLHTPTLMWQTKKIKFDTENFKSEKRSADQTNKLEKQERLPRSGQMLIRKDTERLIPIADIHARLPACQSKYTYYGSHDQILDPEEEQREQEPLSYDDKGSIQMSEQQQDVFNRLVATIGTSQNNWQYCCQIFFKKYPNFVPTGEVRYDKDILEVYLKMQYFGTLKKSLLTTPFSKAELEEIRILLKYFWGNSTVICNHFSARSHEVVCREMERQQKLSPPTHGFLLSLRLRPLGLPGSQERLLEHLQQEVSCLLAGGEELHLLPCSLSSIVCPHRTFQHIPELCYHVDFEAAGRGEEEGGFQAFLQATAREQGAGGVFLYRGPSLATLVTRRSQALFRLPVKTLFRLNGMKRLRDAGFTIPDV